MKKVLKMILKILGKVLLIGLIGFAATFTLYITNGENKLISLPLGRQQVVGEREKAVHTRKQAGCTAFCTLMTDHQTRR